MMYDAILVPTDGRPGTEGAIVRAVDLARTFDATVHALSVVETGTEREQIQGDDSELIREQATERGHAATREVQDRAAAVDLAVVRELREGSPESTILEYVREENIDIVVMGTRGRTEPQSHHLGSTTQRVLARADVPVLAVPINESGSVPESGYRMYNKVVIPTDGSDVVEQAAEHGLAVAERYGAEVRVIYVVDTTTYGLQDTPRSIVGLLIRTVGSNFGLSATRCADYR